MQQAKRCRDSRLSRARRAGLLATVAGLALVAVSPVALAAGPSLRLKIGSAGAGTPVTFAWTAAQLPKGTHVVFQRQVGTGKVWHTVSTLHGQSGGDGTAPALPLGVYSVRVAALARDRVVAARVSSLRVFGHVPLSALFPVISGGNRTTLQTVSTSTNTFNYILSYYLPAHGSPLRVNANRNDCRRIHFDFLPGHMYGTGTAGPAGITVVQQAADPVSATSPYGTAGSLDAAVGVGQSWALNLTSASNVSEYLYIDGWGECDSTRPLGTAGFEIANRFSF